MSSIHDRMRMRVHYARRYVRVRIMGACTDNGYGYRHFAALYIVSKAKPA